MGANKTLVAVVEGVDLEVMQEMANYDDKMDVDQQMDMIFSYEGEKWCAMTSKKAQKVEWWYKRATHKSEENM